LRKVTISLKQTLERLVSGKADGQYQRQVLGARSISWAVSFGRTLPFVVPPAKRTDCPVLTKEVVEPKSAISLFGEATTDHTSAGRITCRKLAEKVQSPHRRWFSVPRHYSASLGSDATKSSHLSEILSARPGLGFTPLPRTVALSFDDASWRVSDQATRLAFAALSRSKVA
jgi:hypothetical protein